MQRDIRVFECLECQCLFAVLNPLYVRKELGIKQLKIMRDIRCPINDCLSFNVKNTKL